MNPRPIGHRALRVQQNASESSRLPTMQPSRPGKHCHGKLKWCSKGRTATSGHRESPVLSASCFGGIFVAFALLATSPASGETHLRVRGLVVAIDHGSITVKEQSGGTIRLSIDSGTNYADVVPSSLDAIKSGSYIGTAVKGPPGRLIAVEIVLVPVDMRAGRVGFYPWDALPDTSGIDSRGLGPIRTNMTNGIVRASGIGRGGRTLSVDLVDGKTIRIAVTSHAPVVRFVRSDRSALSIGSAVVAWTKTGGETKLVVVGKGLSPPM